MHTVFHGKFTIYKGNKMLSTSTLLTFSEYSTRTHKQKIWKYCIRNKKSTDATAWEKKNKAKQNKQRKRKQNKKVLEPDCLSDQFFLTERVVARSFKIIAFSSLFQEITFSNSAIWKGDLMIEKFGFSKFSLMRIVFTTRMVR